MAISQRAAGTWAASNATTQTVTIPVGAASGDMMICVAACKPYTATPTIDQGWSTLYAATGGSTANGNGTGSQRHAVFYKIHTGTESNPTITWGTTSAPGAAVIVVFQKASTEAWKIQTLAAAPVEQAMGTTAFSVNLTTNQKLDDGSWVFSLVSAGDDSATFTRSTTAIAGASVTWNGNHVEYPAAHISTTTSNDLAADLGYRLVTTGVASGATITVTATLSAAERAQASIFYLHVTTAIQPSAITSGEAVGSPIVGRQLRPGAVGEPEGDPGTTAIIADDAGRTVGTGWGTADTGGSWTETVEAGTVTTAVTTGQLSIDDVQTGDIVRQELQSVDLGTRFLVQGRLEYNGIGATSTVYEEVVVQSNGTNGIVLRMIGDFDNDETRIEIINRAGSDTLLGTYTFHFFQLEWMRFKFLVTESRLRAKAWLIETSGGSEPSSWQIDVANPSPRSGGWLGLRFVGNFVNPIIAGGSFIADDLRVYLLNQAVGTPTLTVQSGPTNVTIYPSAIASAEVVPSPTIGKGNVNIVPTAISSAESVGSPVLKPTNTIAPTAIGSAETVGSHSLLPGNVNIVPTAVASAESLVTPTLRATSNIVASAIDGGPLFDPYIYDPGVFDTHAGRPTVLSNAYIVPTAIPSAESFGTPSLLPGTATIAPVAIDSGEVVNSPALKPTNTIAPSAITTDAIIENFNGYADGDPITDLTGWQIVYGSDIVLRAAGHVRAAHDPTGDLINYHAAAYDRSIPGTAYSQVQVVTESGFYTGPAVRINAANGNNYFANLYNTGVVDVVELRVFNSGAPQSAGGAVTATGRYVRIEAYGVSPTRLKIYTSPDGVVWSLLINTTSSTAALQNLSGRVGFLLTSDFSGAGNGNEIDNFQGGGLDLAPPSLGRTIHVSSIASAESVGTPVLPTAGAPLSILPSAIDSAEVVPNPTIISGGVVIAPTGITSGEALGALVLRATATILPSAIASTEQVGTPTVLAGGVLISPSAIGSGETFGTPTVVRGNVTVAPNSISSAEAVGPPVLIASAVVLPGAIGSSEVFGTPAVTPGSVAILPGSIASGESIGSHTVVSGPGTLTIQPASINSAEAVGTPTLLPGGVSIQPLAIASGEAFGSQTVLPGTWPISPTSIGTGEVLGTPTILPGQVQIIPSGVTTAEILGSPVLTIEDLSQFIVPETIASLEAFGFVTFIPGTAYIIPEGIASLEDVQELVLTGSREGWHWNSSNGFGYGRRGGWPGTQSGFGTGNSEPGPSLQSGFARARRNKGEGG